MDPNAGKKRMFNKLSREAALEILHAEDFKRITVSFYRYVILDNIDQLRDQLYSDWYELKVLGRIYLSKEGINAQLSIPDYNWGLFEKNLYSIPAFFKMPVKTAVEDDGKSFFKLTIKIKDQIVADGLLPDQYDVTNVGNHLNAKEWNSAMESGGLVVDMRNHYESEIGRFKGAICPETETFREELPVVKKLLKGKENKKILLYCTGGIRCEKTSAYLKHHGFSDVNQLHGGIIDYARQLQEDSSLKNKFKGRNFVFDERRGERISKEIISSCHQCGSPCDVHVNCKNVNCNLLFLQCNRCKTKHESCCSIECIEIANYSIAKQKELRKGVSNKKIYYSHKKVQLNLKK